MIKDSFRQATTLTALLLLLAASCCCRAETGILYPELRAPYNKIIENIIQGAEDEHKKSNSSPIRHFKADNKTKPIDIEKWANTYNISGIISLGYSSYKLLKDTNLSNTKIILGGIITPPNDSPYSVLSFTPDPTPLFKNALKLKPSIEKIHYIYEQGKHQWILDTAINAAKELKINLNLDASNSASETAQKYKKLLSSFDSETIKTSAIWVPQNSIQKNKPLLNKVLQDSWDSKIIIISNSLSDVKRGALISVYPDNKSIGKQLAQLLISSNTENKERLPLKIPNKNLFHAINIRTAEHLGIHLKRQEILKYDFIYPTEN